MEANATMKTGVGWLDVKTFVMGIRPCGGWSLNLARWRAPGQVDFWWLLFRLVSKVIWQWAPSAQVAFYGPMTSVLTGSQQNPANVSIAPKPMHLELQEHHCLIPNEPLQAGLDENSCDDILNAWLPRGAVFTHLEVRPLFMFIYPALPTHTSSGLPWGLWPKHWQDCQIRNFSSQEWDSLFDVGLW